ncbi:MAG TPA: toll/interleukin-1 receptor domain-containing protein, partial [Thermoanaerobaculia bacterium]|nr:toll/interleukin-1 receptor domain-containing protein [Thermoanaerobaculia bacterium]
MHRKVFLCYSRKDRELFDAFRTHLAPFAQEGLLQVWSDEEIRATEDWDTRIRETIATADAAVLLVSPDLLASSYVTGTEIPLLIQAAESGKLHLAPLFLRQSNPTIPQFDVVDAATGQRGIRITKYQGLNSPVNPVAEQEQAEQDKILAAAAAKLWSALEQLPDARERRRALKGRELTIELRPREGDKLDRRYSKPRYGDLYQGGGTLRLPQLSGLEDHELGRRLFGALFGGDSEWPTILRMALGETVTSPVLHSLRVRIVTNDPELRSLPWTLSQWQHYPLADAQQGWTFELSANTQPTPVARLHMPCSAAMITAEPAGTASLSCEAHHAGIERLLGRVWNHPPRTPYMRKVRTVLEAEALLKEPPRLLYIYCHACTNTEGLRLILEDENGQPAGVPFKNLAALLGSPPPQVIFLHTFGACSIAPPIPGVSLLLHLRRQRTSWQARQEAQGWWEDVFGNGWDPVRAFHEIGPEARRHGAVQTDYEAWETNVSDYTPKIDRPRSRLDRTGQREAVLHAVRDLVNNTRRRVTCIIAYGAPSNLVHHFSMQSIHTLKDWAKDLARIH